MKSSNLSIIALLGFLSMTGISLAETHISGALTGTLPVDTYIVEAQIWVPEDSVLVVEAGSRFRFNGNLYFIVHGSLQAEGTETDSIIFEPNDGYASWYGMHLAITSESPNILRYCRLSGTVAGGIFTEAVETVIDHSLFTDNSALFGGALYSLISNVRISNSVFEYNQSGFKGAALYVAANSTLEVDNSTFRHNTSGEEGGAIFSSLTDVTITNSHFEDNRAEDLVSGTGGVLTAEYSTVTINNSVITGNYSGTSGGALQIIRDSDVTIAYSVITDNYAESYGGGLVLDRATGEIYNTTLDGNSAPTNGSAFALEGGSTLNLYNTAVTNQSTAPAVWIGGASSSTIVYNDFHNNTGGNFSGNVPANIGLVTTTNVNGHPADQYLNIFEAPGYINPVQGNYALQSTSALIDAGDPNSPNDPDGTIADIGAFYFDQSAVSPVSITLTPYNTPIIIPATGGSFDFNIEVMNSGADPQIFDIWTMVTLPNGTVYGPVLNVSDLQAPANWSIDRDRSQAVPGGAPQGTYTYDAYVGFYPDDIWHEDHFVFEKSLTEGGNSIVNEWQSSGEPIAEVDIQNDALSTNYVLTGAFPNPFNPTTVIGYTLHEASSISLTVYDSAGRFVAQLVDGRQEAGAHSVTFDGSHLASGMYFYKLQNNGFTVTRKLVLMK